MLAIILCLISTYLFYTFYWKRRNLPPGPTPLPFLGNIHSTYSVKRVEYKFLEWKEKYGDIYTIWFGGTPMVAINSYDAMDRYFIKMGDKFTGRMDIEPMLKLMRGGIYGVFDTWGEVWKVHRRFALKFFRDFGMGKDQMERRVNSCYIQL